MLGNSGGRNIGHTQIGARALTSLTPAHSGQVAKKKGPAERADVDRVDKDGRRNPLLSLLETEPEPDEAERDALLPAPGHGASLRWVEGEAFRTDTAGQPIPPVFGDVDQGNLQDAWLLGACAALAHAEPAAIVSRVRRRGDGFSVRLGEVSIPLTPEFPNERYADPIPNGQPDTLWVALVEKAFALYEAGSYANLEHGNPGRALELLTGRPSSRISLSPHAAPARLLARLLSAKTHRRAMVLRTREHDLAPPLRSSHGYAILEVGEALRLYNPWGTKNNSRPLASMICEVPLQAVLCGGEAIYIGG
jgi:hypothetical protein